MAQNEIEGELRDLRQQVFQLQHRQEGQNKQWLWWSRIGGGAAIALLAVDVFHRVTMHMPYGDPPPTFFVMAFLTLAFSSVARPTNSPMNTHLCNFALWIIIAVSLVALFTLLQFRGWL